MDIKRIWRPETFQGRKQKKNYFEGWYYKLIDKQRKTVLAIIPGISIGKSRRDSHAFIQVIDAVSGNVEYYRFACEDFKAKKSSFDINIGPNNFCESGLKLALSNQNLQINGDLYFHDIINYPKSFFSPGIMGPFSFVPGMECYHGIVNIHHIIEGSLDINGEHIDMSGGEGYIEKDWGRSFPDSWVWLQANHFEQPKTSFMFSVARIPWFRGSFIGIISFLKTEAGFYKIATYNGGKINYIKADKLKLQASIQSPKYILEFSTKQSNGGILKAPKNGLMHREIEESITAEIMLNLSDCKGNEIFKGSSKWVGMEIAGNIEEML